MDGDAEGDVTVAKGESPAAEPASSDEADRVMRLVGSPPPAGPLPDEADSPVADELVLTPPESLNMVPEGAAERGERKRFSRSNRRCKKLREDQEAFSSGWIRGYFA